MNLVLLSPGDLVAPDRARVDGRRFRHVARVLRAGVGDEIAIGIVDGRIGTGRIVTAGADSLEIELTLDREPPPPLPLALVLALPRPKVLNRTLAAAVSLGVKRIFLVNGWKVEKGFWSSPRLSEENLLEQATLGLEQARDTRMPEIRVARFLRPFVEEELPAISEGTLRLVAHPGVPAECPRGVGGPVTLAIGPEGGWIADEVAMFERHGFRAVSLGERALRVETVVPFLAARLF